MVPQGFGEDLVLTTAFPKRELAASDRACHSSTLLSLGLAPSARLTATTAAALKAEQVPTGLAALFFIEICRYKLPAVSEVPPTREKMVPYCRGGDGCTFFFFFFCTVDALTLGTAPDYRHESAQSAISKLVAQLES